MEITLSLVVVAFGSAVTALSLRRAVERRPATGLRLERRSSQEAREPRNGRRHLVAPVSREEADILARRNHCDQ